MSQGVAAFFEDMNSCIIIMVVRYFREQNS